MSKHGRSITRRLNYELFIFIVTTLSIVNLVLLFVYRDPDILEVLAHINFVLSLIMLLDFLVRLRAADSNRDYFFKKYGWLDLIGAIPITGAQLARLPRQYLSIKLLRQSGEKNIFRDAIENRADTAVLSIALFVILLLEFGSVAILRAEQGSAAANINTADDALWWVLVTISTVGYGDYFPVTERGRFVGLFVILAGVGVFGTLSGFLAKNFLGAAQKNARKQAEAVEKVIQEIKQLRAEQVAWRHAQKKANDDILTRLANLERFLGQPGEGEEGP